MRRPSALWGVFAAGLVAALWISPASAADGSITVGSQWWDQTAPEAKYQEFQEVPQGAFVESFLYRDRLWNGQLTAWGDHAIRTDQSYGLSYRRPRWRADAEYRQLPHNLSFVSRTGYTLVDPATQLLPDSLQRKNQTTPAAYNATMTDFLKLARQTDLGLRTDVTQARLKGRPGRGFQVELKGSRRNRSGMKPYGGSFGFSNAIEAIEPIRQTMAEGVGTVSYTRKRVSAEGSFDYSAFENDFSTLIWDNPKTLTDVVGTPGKGRLDLYPDNQSWRASGKMSVLLPRRTAFTGSLSYGQTTQNDKWLPFTINTAVLAPDTFPLPGSSTNAKALMTTANARLTSHPLPNVGGTARYYWNKYDNRTPFWTLSGQVPYDGAWNGTDVTSHPFGNEQRVIGLDVDWSPISKIALFGTAERTDRKHRFREAPKDHETAFEGKVRVRPRTWLQADARYRHGDRTIDEFDEEDYKNDAGQFIEQQLLRRFDVAERMQNLIDASLSWSGGERATVELTFAYLRNEYDQSTFGLLDELRRSAGVDATLHATARVDLAGNIGWARVHSTQRSRESSGATLVQSDSTNWQARLTDDFITAGGSIALEAVPDRLTLTTSYFYDRSPGIYHLTNFKGTGRDLPGTVYLRQGVGVEARYVLQEGFDVAGRWMWEEYNVSDFATEDVPLLFPTTGASNAIFLGDSILDYHANSVALAITRTF